MTDLPDDVVYQILTYLAPRDVCAFASVSSKTQHILQDASIWSEAAYRHLRISANPAITTKSVFAPSVNSVNDLKLFIEQLVFHWHVSMGTLVAGVALHRRTGFSRVTPRGGIELKLTDSTSDSAYVFGGSFAHLAVPDASPALGLSFSIRENGPFPVEGMHLRIIHAAEPVIRQPLKSSEPMSVNSHVTLKSDAPASQHLTVSSDPHVKICISLNGHLIGYQIVSPCLQFENCYFHISARLLVTEPAVNMLAIDYDRSSTAGYWLRDIALVPAISALPPPPKNLSLPLPDLAAEPQSDQETQPDSQVQPLPVPQSRIHIQFHLQNPPSRRQYHTRPSRRRANFQSRSPRSPRSPQTHSPRSQSQASLRNSDSLMPDRMSSPRARREQLVPQQVAVPTRMRKHMYHEHNHARSPRVRLTTVRARSNR